MDDAARETTDIFLWANNTDGIKKELDVELFLFNKNYTPYTTQFAGGLNAQIPPLFLYDLLNTVQLGAGTGMAVHDYAVSDGEENVLPIVQLDQVGRAETLLHLIEHERQDIVQFSEQEHEFKRMKGIVARFSHKDDKDKFFYVIKMIQQSSVLRGATSWEFRDGSFGGFQAEVAFKIPDDNQVLIVDKDIFVFNRSKFERLFNYEYKKLQLADQKIADIEKQYSLSFADGLDMQTLVREHKKILNKLQKIEIGPITQEQAVEYADEMQLDLMTDDNGAIIIMDGRDLDMFVNVINEDYMVSQVTGKRYEIRSKKLLDEPEGEPPRG